MLNTKKTNLPEIEEPKKKPTINPLNQSINSVSINNSTINNNNVI